MPSRAASLMQALPSILSQVDRLYIYLDKHSTVPAALAADDRIVPLLPKPGEPSFRAAGKFLGIPAHGAPCLFFGFDDDIIYPPDYVDHMTAALHRHQFTPVVGIHGAVFHMPPGPYVTKNRQVLHFQKPVRLDVHVDQLGTGTMAFHSGCLDLDIRQWTHHHCADLMMMIECIGQGIPRFAVRRGRGYLVPIAQNQADSLYRASLADHSTQTALLHEAWRRYPDAWCLPGGSIQIAS